MNNLRNFLCHRVSFPRIFVLLFEQRFSSFLCFIHHFKLKTCRGVSKFERENFMLIFFAIGFLSQFHGNCRTSIKFHVWKRFFIVTLFLNGISIYQFQQFSRFFYQLTSFRVQQNQGFHSTEHYLFNRPGWNFMLSDLVRIAK